MCEFFLRKRLPSTNGDQVVGSRFLTTTTVKNVYMIITYFFYKFDIVHKYVHVYIYYTARKKNVNINYYNITVIWYLSC